MSVLARLTAPSLAVFGITYPAITRRPRRSLSLGRQNVGTVPPSKGTAGPEPTDERFATSVVRAPVESRNGGAPLSSCGIVLDFPPQHGQAGESESPYASRTPSA